MNHKHMPRWLELVVYAVTEAVIICTDISAVIGTAFAWTVLIPALPLAAACVLTVVDCLIILAFYSPTGTLRNIRAFELFMGGLLLAMVITVAVCLGKVNPDAGQVFKGFLPSREMFVNDGLYTTCTAIGGMLMPHAIYIGSALARPRLLEYDQKHDLTTYKPGEEPIEIFYRPSLKAIKSTLRYAGWELCIAVFCFSLFINSAIEIVAGTAVAEVDFNNLSDLYPLLLAGIGKTGAQAFAVSLLFAGIGAGVVSTMAGQTVMEGCFQVKINPIVRRFITRCIAIIPALIVCVSVGADGISGVVKAINYILAIGLIFMLIPLIWYVTGDKYMRVPSDDGTGFVSLKLGWIATGITWFLWVVVIFTNIATLVLLGLGLAD
jgi:metal iron transporter